MKKSLLISKNRILEKDLIEGIQQESNNSNILWQWQF